MEFDFESDTERQQVDAFWSSIYDARLPGSVREFMHDENISVHDLVVLPTDYSLKDETVNVLVQANWNRGVIIPGYSMYYRFKTDGTFVDERSPEPMKYSQSFRPHIERLLAETALNYATLDDDAYTRRNQV